MGIISYIREKMGKPGESDSSAILGMPVSLAGTQNRVVSTDEVWQTDTVKQASDRIIAELIKFEPSHVKTEAFGEQYEVNDQLQKVLNFPNSWDTISDVLEAFYRAYFLAGNAYLIPTYDTLPNGSRVYTGLYTVKPQLVEHVEDTQGLDGYYMHFASGYEVILPADEVIHLKRDYGANSYFGGNRAGRPDTVSLQRLATIDQHLLKGIDKAVDAGYSVRGIIKTGSVLDEKKIRRTLSDFYDRLKASDSAILPLDAKSDFTPIQSDIHAVDVDTLNFVDERILRSFGVSKAVLSGDYTQEQMRAFRATAVEPVIQKMEKEMTKKLFTDRERSFGHAIKFYTGELKYIDSTTSATLALCQAGGILTVNELRSELGYRPLRELAMDENGKPLIMMSKNYGAVDSVKDQVILEAGYTDEEQDKTQEDTKSST